MIYPGQRLLGLHSLGWNIRFSQRHHLRMEAVPHFINVHLIWVGLHSCKPQSSLDNTTHLNNVSIVGASLEINGLKIHYERRFVNEWTLLENIIIINLTWLIINSLAGLRIEYHAQGRSQDLGGGAKNFF